MRYKNFSGSLRNNPDISHLKHAKMGDYVVVYYRDGEWYAGMPMSRTDAENLASDYRTLRNTPALVHNAQQLLRMGLPEGPPRRGSPAYIGNPRKNPSTGAGKATYIVSVTGPTGSESFPYYGFDKGKAEIALREAEGLPKGFKVRFMEWKHGASRPKMITSGNRKNPATRGISESKARQWVRDTLKIDGSAPYPGRIGPAMQAKLGWAFQVTFRNAQRGKQKGFGPEFDRWYLVGIDQDGHEFLQLTRPEFIFGLRDKPSRSHR